MWPNKLEDRFYGINYAADTVLLARGWNINSILKRALYELVVSPGFKQSETDQIDSDMEYGDNQSVLSSSDFSLLVYTREQLTTFWMQKAMPPRQPATCKSPENSHAYQACAVTRRRIHDLYKILVHDSKLFEYYRYDPIQGLQVFCKAPWIKGEAWPRLTQPQEGLQLPGAEVGYLCSACAKKWRVNWRVERTQLWNNLDTWFDVCNEEGNSEE